MGKAKRKNKTLAAEAYLKGYDAGKADKSIKPDNYDLGWNDGYTDAIHRAFEIADEARTIKDARKALLVLSDERTQVEETK